MFPPGEHPDLLVGLGEPDDAAVYRLDPQQAMVVTADFFTPIVDDAYDFGAIAAANSLSDVYATGGRPILALNLAALPNDLPEHVTGGIFRGAAEKVRQAGAVIAGGHSAQDREPKFGLVVIGLAHPDRLLTKGGARPGDVLVLTKPLGTGTITTAAKLEQAEAAHVAEAVEWMMRLNGAASEATLAAGGVCATDVTGFGLLGHASEMARASGVTLQLDCDAIPLMTGARRYADQAIFPGGSRENRRHFGAGTAFDPRVSEPEQMLLFDAQTSGGLLIALPGESVDSFAAEMSRRNAPWWRIGEVLPRGDHDLIVVRA